MSTSEIIALMARLQNIEADIARIDAVLVMLAQLSRPAPAPAPALAKQAPTAVAKQAAPRKRTPGEADKRPRMGLRPAKRIRSKPAKVTIAEVKASPQAATSPVGAA